jgi:glutamate dehydrogenase (NAD(P)+)
VVSFFEWTQNRRGESWTLEEVRNKLKAYMDTAYAEVSRTVKELKTEPRLAAYVVGLRRLQGVYRERGIFP